MIKTEGLTKHFGKKVAVNNLNLQIAKGEFFVFLGPNAAGKTTTIKLLTGLLKPTEGEILIDDFVILSNGRIVCRSAKSELIEQKKSLEEVFIESVEINKDLPELEWLF